MVFFKKNYFEFFFFTSYWIVCLMETDTVGYDYCVVGAGVAGLTLSKILSTRGQRILLLDSSDRFGGRLLPGKFESTPDITVSLGGAVTRFTDNRVLSLARELGLSYHTYSNKNITYTYPMIPHDTMKKNFIEWKELLVKHGGSLSKIRMSTEMCLRKYYPQEDVNLWKQICGYSDFWNADVLDTLSTYDFEEMFWYESNGYVIDGGYSKFIHTLVDKTCDSIHTTGGKAKNHSKVVSVSDYHHGCEVVWKGGPTGKLFRAFSKKTVFATTIKCLREICVTPSLPFLPLVESHPYLRIYTLHEPESVINMPDIKITDGPLRKTIVTNREKGVVLGCYSDDYYVNYWHTILRDGSKNEILTHINVLYQKYDIPEAVDVVYKLWEEGIHYYTPTLRQDLDSVDREVILREKFIHPSKNIYVCGEMVSIQQGWTEGALESVERLLTMLN